MPTSPPDTEAPSSARRRGWLLLIGTGLLSLLLLIIGGIALAWPWIEDARLRAHIRELRGEIDYAPTAFGGNRERQAARWIQLSHDAIRKLDFAKLETLPHLRRLSIYESHLDGELCHQIARLRTLELLDIEDSYLASDALVPLGMLPNLDGLYLARSKLEDETMLAALVNAPQLRIVDLVDSGLTDAGGQALGRLSMLEDVSLNGTRVGDATLRELKQLSALKSLAVGSTAITDEGIAHLASCTALEWLDVSDTVFTGRTLGELKSLTKLAWLNLGQTRVTDEHAAQLRDLPSVTILDLSDTPLTDATVVHLVRMSQLETLHLDGTALTDAGLAQLVQMPQLRSLQVDRTQVTAAAADQVREQYPDLDLSAPTNNTSDIQFHSLPPASRRPQAQP